MENIENIIENYLKNNLKIKLEICESSSSLDNYGNDNYQNVTVTLLLNEKELTTSKERIYLN